MNVFTKSCLFGAILGITTTACWDPPLSEDAIPSECEVAVQIEGRILSDELFTVSEGEVLAVNIEDQPPSGFGVERRVAAYRIIDASLDNSQGYPALSTTPGQFNQQYTSEFGQLVTIAVPPGEYELHPGALTGGTVGTCDQA